MKGFSLLEVLIVVTIVALLASASSGLYSNYNKGVEIKSVAETLLFDLKEMQSKSMVGENDSAGLTVKWGIHFVNGATQYYELFSTPTTYSDVAKKIIFTKYLSKGLTFTDPATSSTKDIIFNRISGGSTASSVSITSSGSTKTLSVSTIGNITVQ